jgi:hypothetical protein
MRILRAANMIIFGLTIPIVGYGVWDIGRQYERKVLNQQIAVNLTAPELGKYVGVVPNKQNFVLKKFEFVINGENRKFVIAEINRYGPNGGEMGAFDYKGTPIARIVRVDETDELSLIKPDDCIRSQACFAMQPVALYESVRLQAIMGHLGFIRR